MANIPHPDSPSPGLTVVVVSDYEAGEKTWADEIAMVRALAAQDINGPFQIIIAESSAHEGKALPQQLLDAYHDLKLIYHPSQASAELKDAAVAQCETPWVAVLEADALPEPSWLRLLLAAARDNPAYDTFSGRTYYGEETAWRRALNLLDRSFDDCGKSGETAHVSNNGALYRTEMLKQFPYPQAATPFLSARLRMAAMNEAGVKFYFCREARTRHAIGGLSFVRDVRRNTGFSDMMQQGRRAFRRMPAVSSRRMLSEGGAALRLGGEYLKWTDWPLWAAMFLFARIPEWNGMREALRDVSELEGSAYR